MKVAVVGAGAVGCLFGVYLARAGHAVELIGRPAFVAAARAHGLRIEGRAHGSYAVLARTALAPDDAPEVVLLTVKTYDVAPAATDLARALRVPVPLLLLQNGLGVERTAESALRSGGWADPPRWTVRAIHSIPATLLAPGVVRAAGSGELLLPDAESAGAVAPHALRFRNLFAGAGFEVRDVPDLEREVWRKALVNAAINPVTALLGVTNGELAHEPGRSRALRLLEEARAAAASAGYEFSPGEVVADFDRVVRATAANRSSMLQDIDRGRPSEIDAISGEILRVAERRGLDLPETRTVVAEVARRVTGGGARPQRS